MSVTAAWPLPRLVSALARAGWHELHGRRGGAYRAILRALCDLLPHGSATGHVTAPQLADAAGISERWARHILTGLEEAGLITWTRGGIIDGRPTPSLIRVSKQALADLVRRARPEHDAELARRAATTAQRLRDTLRLRTLRRSQPARSTARREPRRAAPVHAELSATLPPNGEVTQGSAPVIHTLITRPRPAPGPRLAELRRRLAHLDPTPTP